MVSRVYMTDVVQDNQFTVLSDSSHGTGGMQLGQIEIMLHRRCLEDDNRGVGETLNEDTRYQPQLWLLFDGTLKSAELHRVLSLFQQFPLTIIGPGDISTQPVPPFSALQQEFPLNLHLLTLRSLAPYSNSIILRLQHIFEVDEHPIWSQPVKIDLNSTFIETFQVHNVTEMNLTANQLKSSVHKLHWNINEPTYHKPTKVYHKDDPTQVVLNPMEIHTFIVNLS